MKIISWNINGIRASKTNLKTLFDSLNSDVICLQETKVTRDMLDESSAIVEGYNSYFSFSRKRSGYSGTANFCRDSAAPTRAEEGLSGVLTTDNSKTVGHYGNHTKFPDEELKSLDVEGRTVITQHRIRHTDGEEKDLAIINVYCPRFDPDRTDRFQYKMQFHALLQTRAEAILRSGSHVIILGDLNTTHKAIDRCEQDNGESNRLPGRQWLNQMLWEEGRDPGLITKLDSDDFTGITAHTVGANFVDTFRHLHPDQEGAYSNWCTLTNARSTNYGRRLDFILADVELTKKSLTSATILPDVEGSDHCPVAIELDCTPVAAKVFPPLCTKHMPEFSGKQQKLSSFFTKLNKKDVLKDERDTGKSGAGGDITETKKADKGVIPRTDTANITRTDQGPVKASEAQGLTKKESGIKRSPGKRLQSSQPMKKQKTAELKKTNSGGGAKQANLMSFFKGGNSCKIVTNSKSVNNVKEAMQDQSGAKSEGDMHKGGLQKLSVVAIEDNTSVASKQTETTSTYFTAGQNSIASSGDGVITVENTDTTRTTQDSHSSQSSAATMLRENSTKTASAWKNLLGGLGPAPLCKGHKEACVLRMVKKAGPNKGRQFYTCARGEGLKTNPEARCDFFKWIDKKK